MAETIQQALNRADPNTIADMFRSLKIGDILRAQNVAIHQSPTAVDPTGAVLAATGRITPAQAENARAGIDSATSGTIIAAWGRVGAGAPGPLLPAAFPPAAGQISVGPNGSIVTNPADAWTSMDVTYLVDPGDVVEVEGDVVPATGIMSLPISITGRGVKVLISAVALTGGAVGNKEVTINPAPAAGLASENPAKNAVLFAVADLVTKARVRLLIANAVDVNASLGSIDFVFV